MSANYLSAETNQNDLVRHARVTDKNCDPWSGCHVSKESFCAGLLGETNYLYGEPRRLSSHTLAFFHTSSLPAATPTLAVDLRSPGSHAFKPQAFIAPVSDDVTENVFVWANWLNVKKQYRGGRKLHNFRVILFARDPRNPSCDQTKQPPP